MVNEERVIDAYIDQPPLEAVAWSTSFARRALRARAAFFWSLASEPPALVGAVGESGLDADAVARSYATHVLSAPAAVAVDTPRALAGVAVRGSDGVHGVLFVVDDISRAFDIEDLALIDDVGAGLARELDRDAAIDLPRASLFTDSVPPPIDALVKLSDALVRDIGSAGAVRPGDYLEAADRLSVVAARLRELAAAETRTARNDAVVAAREVPTSPGGGARILLADDLDLNRKLISDMLTVEGHHVDCVADGAAAVQAVQAKTYDLVLMDMIMPGMDGIAATRAIRALPSPASRVPIVALTANTFKEQLESCLEAGMDATLTKPMTFETLTDAVATWACGRTVAA